MRTQFAVERLSPGHRGLSILASSLFSQGHAPQARQIGLLDNRRVAELLADEVRRRSAGQELKKVLDEIRSVPSEPLTMDEIGPEIKAARADRRAREARR